MAAPTMPDGCLIYSNFGFDVMSNSKAKFFIYAIVDCSEAPSPWDDDGKVRPRRLSFSRDVIVTGDRNYKDSVRFYGGEQESYKMGDADYTSASGYQTFVESSDKYRPNYGSGMPNGREFGVLEFTIWDDYEFTPADGCFINAVSCETINDKVFSSGGSTREHVERNAETFDDDTFASSYHIMWCLAASVNRCSYEDRMCYCWPVFADRTQPPS